MVKQIMYLDAINGEKPTYMIVFTVDVVVIDRPNIARLSSINVTLLLYTYGARRPETSSSCFKSYNYPFL